MLFQILGQDGRVVQIRIKQSTPFKKIFAAYCERTRLAPESARFIFEGIRVRDSDTPSILEMEDGDSIEAYHEQTGGALQ